MTDDLTTVVQPFSWSYSRLKNFETCPLRHLSYDIDKSVVEPESDQLRQGNQLHEHFRARIAEGKSLPLGYGQYEPILARLVNTPGAKHTEQKLAITSGFKPAAYFAKTAWFRTILDYVCMRDDGVAVVVDFKTGKPNADFTQLQLMAATLFHHEPKLQRVRAVLLFVGYDHTERAEYVREDLPEIWGEILPRVKLMQEARAAQAYPPRPSGLCKRYCAVRSCAYCGK